MNGNGTAVYLRVSSQQQDVISQSDRVKAWLDGHRIQTSKWYIDGGVTGATMQRPRLLDLQEAIFAGEVDTVVIYSIDRLARTMVDGLIQLDKWRKTGIRLVFVEDMLDLRGVADPIADVLVKCMISMRLAFAEAEREKLRARQRAGIESARRRQEAVRKLAAKGNSAETIAAELDIPLRLVRKMIAAPPGKLYWGQGGRPRGITKGSPARAYRLYQRGYSLARIAAQMGLTGTTVGRYVQQEEERRKPKRPQPDLHLGGLEEPY